MTRSCSSTSSSGSRSCCRADIDGPDAAALMNNNNNNDDWHKSHQRSSEIMKPNSTYVPHNRLSRYLAAISSLALVRFRSAPGSELPLDKIGLLSSATFRWLNEYLYAGYKNGMRDKALPRLSHRESCEVNGPRFEALLHAHFVEKGQAGASIPAVAWQFVRTRVLAASLVGLLGDLVALAGPAFVLGRIIQASEAKADMLILGYTLLLILVEVCSQLLLTWSSALSLRTACRLRSACLAVSYKKLLGSSLGCSTAGAQQILTYFAPDSDTLLYELVLLGPSVLSGPTVIALVSLFACLSLGWLALAGVLAVALLHAGLVAAAACFAKSFAARAIEYSLRRMALLEEFVGNMWLAKITLWDGCFKERIRDARRRELAEMRLAGFCEGCGISMAHIIPIFTVSTITLLGLLFDKRVPFAQYAPVLVLFLVNLKSCLRSSWMGLSSISRGLALLNKLKTILTLREADRHLDRPIDRSFAIVVRNGHFAWSCEPLELLSTPACALSAIDLCVPKGQLVGIYGRQRSGKSSLLLSLLGQLRCVGGAVAVDGSCAYASAEAWLMDGTVRENVLLYDGDGFDSARYYRTLRATNLEQELDDSGAESLGSSQRQRLALARALYAQRDITLLDEPLAGLPWRERLEVLDRVAVELGQCGRTVLVASASPELLRKCHVVYALEAGRIVAHGSNLPHFVRCSSRESWSSSCAAEVSKKQCGSMVDDCSRSFPALGCTRQATRSTRPGVYLGGWTAGIPLVLLSGLYSFGIGFAPVCVAHVAYRSAQDVASGLLVALVGSLVVCGLALAVAYSRSAFRAASELHERWIEKLCHAQISVLDAALLLNACSLQQVDCTVLPRCFASLLVNSGLSVASLLVLGLLSPWLILPALAFLLLSVAFGVYVRGAALSLQELKLSSATLALSSIDSAVLGRATIQAYSREKEFAKKQYKLFNESSTYGFMHHASRLWLELRLKLLSVLVIGAVIFMGELLHDDGSLLRLSLAYICALQLTLSVRHATSALNGVYTGLMAVNSVDHYMNTMPKEREGAARLSSTWPVDGSLEFRNVSLCDREEWSRQPLSFAIFAGEKVGVLSAQPDTRAAFVSALYRFAELPSGEILIGGTSTSQVPLATLRGSVCFVPGDAALFNGTIRHNLDPTERLADQSLMRVLQRVHLWDRVSRLPNKLVSDASHLFAARERVLVFLARALLNERTKIIILEEAEADDAADDTVDVTLREAFNEHTVIRLSSHRMRFCQKFITLDDEAEDCSHSDQGPQLTAITELYAQPADSYNLF